MATGFASRNRGPRRSIARFSDVPRAAKASPYPTRFAREALRVFWLKVSEIASNSVWRWKQPSAAVLGSVFANVARSVGSWQAPWSSSPLKTKPSGAALPVPRTISRYLRPNADL